MFQICSCGASRGGRGRSDGNYAAAAQADGQAARRFSSCRQENDPQRIASPFPALTGENGRRLLVAASPTLARSETPAGFDARRREIGLTMTTTINLATYRQNGESDNDAFNRAMATSPTNQPLEIYFPAGGGSPSTGGIYEIWANYWANPPLDTIPSVGNITRGDLKLYGDPGYQSVIRQPNERQTNFLSHPPQSDLSRVLFNIEIYDLLLDGNLFSRTTHNPPYPYDEELHNIRISGVNNLRIERVYFRNFSGEGLNLSSVNYNISPRNSNLVVKSCLFEGFPGIRGRNAIAILDCDTWLIDSCTFKLIGSTRPGVAAGPAAIDVEPEINSAIVTNGMITQCVFDGLNRNALAVLNLPGANVRDVDFINCQVKNANFGIAEIRSAKKVRINNVIAKKLSLELGGPIITTANCEDVYMISCDIEDAGFCRLETGTYKTSINNNLFRRCGNQADGVVLQAGATSFFSFLYNQLYDCGVVGQPSPIYFLQVNQEFKFSNIKWNTVHLPNNIDRVGLTVFNYSPPPNLNPLYDYIDPLDNYPAGLSLGDFVKKP